MLWSIEILCFHSGVDCSTKKMQLKENKWGIFRVFFSFPHRAGMRKMHNSSRLRISFEDMQLYVKKSIKIKFDIFFICCYRTRACLLLSLIQTKSLFLKNYLITHSRTRSPRPSSANDGNSISVSSLMSGFFTKTNTRRKTTR